jgi:hypothetical protein
LFTSAITAEQIAQLGDEPHLFQALVEKRYGQPPFPWTRVDLMQFICGT